MDPSMAKAETPQRVSVCMPVYNCADTIERSIDSVLAQTYTDLECVVVDNNSDDSTVELVEAYTDPRIRIVRNERNLGLVGNHNMCVRVAQGALIQFVHGDDWLLPDCVEKLIPSFEAENVGLAFAPRRVISTDESWKARFGRLEGPLRPLGPVNKGADLIRRYLAAGGVGNLIGEPTSVMLRRESLIAAGGFRSVVPQLQDIDAWLRVLTRYDAAFVDEELTVRWHHDGSATDAYAGTAAVDQMWVLSDLFHNSELATSLRLHAFRLWARTLLRSPYSIVRAPRGQRADRSAGLAAAAFASLFRRPQFELGSNG